MSRPLLSKLAFGLSVSLATISLAAPAAMAADGMPEDAQRKAEQQATTVEAETDAPFGVVVTADKPVALRLSNRDVNRIACEDGNIEDFRYSSEKGIEADARGSNFFVKFQIRQQGQHLSYVTQRSEFFVQCAGEMFTLYAEPTNVASQTVFLRAGRERRAAATVASFAPLSHEERAGRLIKATLTEDFADSFRVANVENPSFVPGPMPGLFVRPYRSVSVDGLAMRAAEYHVTSDRDVVLDERMFLRPEFGTSIYTVTIAAAEHRVVEGRVARVVITTIGEGGL